MVITAAILHSLSLAIRAFYQAAHQILGRPFLKPVLNKEIQFKTSNFQITRLSWWSQKHIEEDPLKFLFGLFEINARENLESFSSGDFSFFDLDWQFENRYLTSLLFLAT